MLISTSSHRAPRKYSHVPKTETLPVFANAIYEPESELNTERGNYARLKSMNEQVVGSDEMNDAQSRSESVQDVMIQRLVLGSSLATVGAGMQLRRLVCGFDTCNVTIQNLPPSIQKHEIEELLVGQGIDPTLFYVLNTRLVDRLVQATVVTAKRIWNDFIVPMNGMEFRGNALLFDVVETPVAPNSATPLKPIPNFLTISWSIHPISMHLAYSSHSEAREAVTKLNNSEFRGCRISAKLEQRRRSRLLIATNVVKLSGLPDGVTRSEIQELSGAHFASDPLFNYNFFDVRDSLRSHMECSGGLEEFRAELSNSVDSVEATAIFGTWREAKQAYDSLSDEDLGIGLPVLDLWLPEPIQYVTTIPQRQFHAQKRLWNTLTEDQGCRKASVRVMNKMPGKTLIQVVGDDQKAIGRLKIRVEHLIAGETLDDSYWHHLLTTSSGQKFLGEINSRIGPFIQSDWKTRTLKLYTDSQDKKANALKVLRLAIDRLQSLAWTVSLDRRSVRYFAQEGLDALNDKLGKNGAALHLSDSRCMLSIRGGEATRRTVTQFIKDSKHMFQSILVPEARDTDNAAICPVCLDEASMPVTLTCGHVYCSACMRHYLATAAERSQFPLVCAGDEARCNTTIAIPTIQSQLTSCQFTKLIEAAVINFIERHPDTVRYCSTPDCTQLYRCWRFQNETDAQPESRPEQVQLTCPSCYAAVCI
ncbi:hypothetical protein AX17_002165 [Amanita inopinata Kibby_2008]|nr:hypothetical protein AX17_002165 [Amanita inopinata Kibby_2008]